MNWLTGTLAAAGAIGSAILEWARNGGGRAGWNAARDMMNTRWPGVPARTVETIIDRAQETVAIGNRYENNSPNYVPDLSQLPDLRPAERYAGIGGAGGSSGEDARVVYHHVEIRIENPNDPDFHIQHTIQISEKNDPMSRSALEDAAQEAAELYLQKFLNYDPERLEQYGFTTSFTIRGAYIGY